MLGILTTSIKSGTIDPHEEAGFLADNVKKPCPVMWPDREEIMRFTKHIWPLLLALALLTTALAGCSGTSDSETTNETETKAETLTRAPETDIETETEAGTEKTT